MSLSNEFNSEDVSQVKHIEIRTRSVLFYSGSIFSFTALLSIGILYYDIIHQMGDKSPAVVNLNGSQIVSIFFKEIIILIVLFISSLFAFLSFKGAGNINRKVIPDSDRDLLNELISKDEAGIDQYIRLSSLSGTTGFFTKLGLTGLPLATIGLTIIFTLLYMFSGKEPMFDLAKLTLGAFLGSYVQKVVPPATPKKGDQNIQITPLHPGPAAASGSENPNIPDGPLA